MNIKKKQIIENLLEAFRVAWESKSELKTTQTAAEIEATIVNQFGTDRDIDVYKKIAEIKTVTGAAAASAQAARPTNSLSAADFQNSKKKTNTASLGASPAVEDNNLVKIKTKRATEIENDDIEEDDLDQDDIIEKALQLISMDNEAILSQFGTYLGVKAFAKEVLDIKLPMKKVDGMTQLRENLNKIIVDADGNTQG